MKWLGSLRKRLDGITPEVEIDADSLLKATHSAARIILDRRAELDRTGHQDTPLIVIAGEQHTRPADKVHHMLLLNELHRAEKIALAYEYPHNVVEKFLKPHVRNLWKIMALDHHGAISIKTQIGLVNPSAYAPLSTVALLRFALNNNIPVRFTDTAYSDSIGTIDHTDFSTAASLKACFGEAHADICAHTANHIFVRNHHMSSMGLGYARYHGTRILVQQCGDAHITGCKKKEGAIHLKSEHSLAAHYNAQNIPFITICDLKPENVPETDLRKTNISMHPNPEMSKRTFNHARGKYSSQSLFVAEAVYLNALLMEVGLPDETVWPKDRRILINHYRHQLTQS